MAEASERIRVRAGGRLGGSTTRRRGRNGRTVAARRFEDREPIVDVAVDATLRAVANHGARPGGSLAIARDDLRARVRERRIKGLVVFVLDASDSMGGEASGGDAPRVEACMAAAKGAVIAMLTRSYQRRDRVAVITFRDEAASVLLPPTTSVERARAELTRLPIGGATPMAAGLWRGWELIRSEMLKDPNLDPLLVVISDGQANVSLDPRRRALPELLELGRTLRARGARALVIDTASVLQREPQMRRLAEALGASYRRIDSLQASTILSAL